VKTVFKIIAGLLVVIIIAIAAVIVTFDPNDYKVQISDAVKQQTGRTLTIDGTISLSLFPWVGLELGKLSLSNAKGFSKAEFARMDQLDIKVKLLPLLWRKIEIDKVRLHGLFVSLETNKDGTTNWQDLSAAPAVAETPAAPAEKTAPPALAGLLVNGIDLVGANIQWLDNQSGVEAKISDLNLETGAIKFDAWIPVSFTAQVNNSQPELDADIDLKTQVKINQALNVFDVQGFRLDLGVLMKSIMATRMKLTVNMDANADLQTQTVKLSTLNVSALGASLNTVLTITGLDKQPLIKGTLSSNSIKPRVLAERFGIELPATRDSWALTALNFSSTVEAGTEFAKLDNLVVKLDKSTLSGFVHVNKIAQPEISYQLALDTINVDAYLPAPATAAPASAPSTAPPADVAIELPLELLRKLGLDGEFSIAALSVSDIAISDLSMQTSATGGVIKIDPLSMNLLGGTATAGLTLDARGTPAYQINAKASDIKPAEIVNPMLAGLLGNQKLALEGVAQLNADIKTHGNSLNALKQAATGSINISMGQTSVTGVDIDYYLRDAVASFAESKKIYPPENFRGVYTPEQKTAFDKVVVSAKLGNGKVNNDQLLLDSRRLKVNGSGVIDIMANTLDEKVNVQLDAGRQKTIAEKILQKPVGVRIHGPFAQPAIDVDYASLGSAITAMLKDEAKAKVQEKTDAMKAEAQARIDAEKQRLKQEADAKKAELEKKAIENLKDSAKDRLKKMFK
jgi:AsmA protein